jgi:hypothetical protein
LYAFLSLPHGDAPYHGVEPQPHESPLAGAMPAADKSSIPLEEKNALTINVRPPPVVLVLGTGVSDPTALPFSELAAS